MEAELQPDDRILRSFAGYGLKRAWMAVQSDLTCALEAFDLRLVSYSALAIIVDNPGLRPSHLADLLALERSNLVGLIDLLEQRRLIERRACRTDRRAQTLYATPAGKSLQDRARAAIAMREEALFAGITTGERTSLVNSLRKIESAAVQSKTGQTP